MGNVSNAKTAKIWKQSKIIIWIYPHSISLWIVSEVQQKVDWFLCFMNEQTTSKFCQNIDYKIIYY